MNKIKKAFQNILSRGYEESTCVMIEESKKTKQQYKEEGYDVLIFPEGNYARKIMIRKRKQLKHDF